MLNNNDNKTEEKQQTHHMGAICEHEIFLFLLALHHLNIYWTLHASQIAQSIYDDDDDDDDDEQF